MFTPNTLGNHIKSYFDQDTPPIYIDLQHLFHLRSQCVLLPFSSATKASQTSMFWVDFGIESTKSVVVPMEGKLESSVQSSLLDSWSNKNSDQAANLFRCSFKLIAVFSSNQKHTSTRIGSPCGATIQRQVCTKIRNRCNMHERALKGHNKTNRLINLNCLMF